MARIPHFDYPFRFSGSVAAVVEQDSDKDVINCITAIALTVKGQRLEDPSFGITQPVFQRQPIDLATMTEEILSQEPRATVLLDQAPDSVNPLLDTINIAVARKEPST